METVPAESATTHPVLTQEQCEALINEFFTQGKVHNYYACFNKCSKVSEQELRRIKQKKFNREWVEKIENWWLCHVEGEGMFCIVCKKKVSKANASIQKELVKAKEELEQTKQ